MITDASMFPHSTEAERAVIGSIVLDNERLYDVADFLTADDFYLQSNANLYRIIGEMLVAGTAIDLVTLKNSLMHRQLLDAVGGIAYVASLIDGVGSTANVAHYGRIVREKAMQRRIKAAAYNALHSQDDSQRLAATLNDALIEAADPMAGTVLDAPEIAMAQSDMYEEAQRNPRPIGYTTHLRKFDDMTRGLQPGELSLWGGCPSSGKTSVLTSFVNQMPEVPAGIISIETNRAMIVNRMVSGATGIPLSRILGRDMTPTEWKTLHQATAEIGSRGNRLWICDRAPITLDQIRALVKKRRVQNKTRIVWIDYFNLIAHHPISDKVQYKAHEVYAEISRGLKALTKELDIHIACLLQLTKDLAPTQEPDRRHMTDTRVLEWDADLIVFLWKREGKVVGSDEHMWTVYKNRNGETGRFSVAYKRECTAFGDAE